MTQFKPNDKVLYKRLDKVGTIIEMISPSRYIVNIAGVTWSISTSFLEPFPASIKS